MPTEEELRELRRFAFWAGCRARRARGPRRADHGCGGCDGGCGGCGGGCGGCGGGCTTVCGSCIGCVP
ncbi:MAG: hypothetical protein QW379_08115 [Thermoplasmata archaeon]